MLRQIIIFENQATLFNHSLAFPLIDEEVKKIIDVILPNMVMPTPGQTFHRPILNSQIFHRSYGDYYFLLILDLADSIDYVNQIILKIIDKFKGLVANAGDLKENEVQKTEFIKYLYYIQKELHSKIAIVGPVNAGKTTLFKLMKSGQEKNILDFAKSATFELDDLNFDLWDFQLHDNFSLLWSKFIGGSDLVILIFDSKNYNLKILEQFFTLKNNNAKYSKLLVIANKSDLIDKEEFERIKSITNMSNIIEMSLLDTQNAKEKIKSSIINTLNLKRDFPIDIDTLLQEAEKLENENNVTGAIAKYENLINISRDYQLISYLESFLKKLEQLKIKLQKASELIKKTEIKAKTFFPEQIKFTKKISVKSLPTTDSELKSLNKSRISHHALKPTNNASIDKDLSKKSQLSTERKLTLKPEDIKLSLKSKIERIQMLRQKDPVKSESPIFNDSDMYKPIPEQKELSPEKNLQKLIENLGSELNIELCKLYIEELHNTLNTQITYEDLKLAAEIFSKLEKSQ